jgi:hypothetical protein
LPRPGCANGGFGGSMNKPDNNHGKIKLKKRRISLPDGRYLIYFTFEESTASKESPLPDKSRSESSKNQDV